MYPYNFPLAPPPGYEYDDGYDGAGPPPAPPPSGPTLPSQPLPGHLLPTPAPAPPPPQPLRPLMYPPEYPYPYYPYVPVYQYPMAPPVEEPVAALNYKPIQTKRNVKPRINKIEGSHPGPAHASQSTAHASHASHATPGGSTTRGHGQGAAPAPSPPAPAAAPARLPGEVVTDAIFNHLLAELGISRTVGDTVTLSYQLKLKNPLEFQLFEYFTTTLLPALDLYLPHPLFGRVVPDLALYDDTNMLLHLVLCVLLVAHARRTPDPSSVPLRYYHQAIQLIRHQLAAPGVEQLSHGVIARCLLLTVFLCIYEMFFVAVDLTYVRGALTILLLILARKPRGVLAELPLYYACFVVILACDAYRGLLCDAPPHVQCAPVLGPVGPPVFRAVGGPRGGPGLVAAGAGLVAVGPAALVVAGGHRAPVAARVSLAARAPGQPAACRVAAVGGPHRRRGPGVSAPNHLHLGQRPAVPRGVFRAGDGGDGVDQRPGGAGASLRDARHASAAGRRSGRPRARPVPGGLCRTGVSGSGGGGADVRGQPRALAGTGALSPVCGRAVGPRRGPGVVGGGGGGAGAVLALAVLALGCFSELGCFSGAGLF